MGKYSKEVKTKEQAAFLQPVHHAKSHMRLCGFDISRHSNAHRFRAVGTLGGGAVFSRSVNPISNRRVGEDYAHHIETPPHHTHTRFSDPPTALRFEIVFSYQTYRESGV